MQMSSKNANFNWSHKGKYLAEKILHYSKIFELVFVWNRTEIVSSDAEKLVSRGVTILLDDFEK